MFYSTFNFRMSLYLHSKEWKQLVFFFLLCSTFISVHLRSKACLCCRWTMNEFDNPGLQCSHFKAGQTLTFDTKVFFAVGVTNYRVNVSRAIFVTSSAAVAKGEFVYLRESPAASHGTAAFDTLGLLHRYCSSVYCICCDSVGGE